jgi:hypothetical protein
MNRKAEKRAALAEDVILGAALVLMVIGSAGLVVMVALALAGVIPWD